MQTGGSDKRGLAEINVTPLVDIMLVLLIIFMVSAPMMQQGVQLTLPKADAAPSPADDSAIVVSVTRDRKLFLGEVETSLKEIGAQIQQMRGDNPNRKVFLRADEQVVYGTVVRVMAALERAGVQDLGMMTDPEN